MVRVCCVCGVQQSKSIPNPNRMFHRLPKNPETRNKWLQILGKGNVKELAVCSNHFLPKDYRPLCDKSLLQSYAVPRLNVASVATCGSLPESQNVHSENFVNEVESSQLHENTMVGVESPTIIRTPSSPPAQLIETSCLPSEQAVTCCSASRGQSISISSPPDQSILPSSPPSEPFNPTRSSPPEQSTPTPSSSPESLSTPSPPPGKSAVPRTEVLKRKRGTNNDEFDMPPKKRVNLKEFGIFRSGEFKEEASWRKFMRCIRGLKGKIEVLSRRNERLVSKIETYKHVIDELKRIDLLTDSAAVILNKTWSDTVLELIQAILFGKKHEFPPELKEFACTLHFYPPSAYEYARQTLMKVFSHESTIRRWMHSINFEPGISTEVLNSIQELCQNAEAEGKKIYFSLTFDEMAIRKNVEVDSQGKIT
ncbi:uncharacterized protein LOC107041363 [Diachasma alloeum]|uniref:uncharacterized protein LOC107041363 n=1 Tax=Diachasma alloeum TaxID=454923 RepID=UPI00073830E3|nr:uncharacterized protein LOC107041363 [Diachasma alloeum]